MTQPRPISKRNVAAHNEFVIAEPTNPFLTDTEGFVRHVRSVSEKNIDSSCGVTIHPEYRNWGAAVRPPCPPSSPRYVTRGGQRLSNRVMYSLHVYESQQFPYEISTYLGRVRHYVKRDITAPNYYRGRPGRDSIRFGSRRAGLTRASA